MIIDILTLFPDMISGFLNESIIKRSINKGLVTINIHDFRKYSLRSNNQVDDTPMVVVLAWFYNVNRYLDALMK